MLTSRVRRGDDGRSQLAGVAGAGRPPETFLHVTGRFAGPETCRLDTPGHTAYCVAVGDALLAYACAPLAEEATELPLNK